MSWRKNRLSFSDLEGDAMDTSDVDDQAHTPVFNRDSPLMDGAATPRMPVPVGLNRGGRFAATPPGTPPYAALADLPTATPKKSVSRNSARARAEMASTRKSSFADLRMAPTAATGGASLGSSNSSWAGNSSQSSTPVISGAVNGSHSLQHSNSSNMILSAPCQSSSNPNVVGKPLTEYLSNMASEQAMSGSEEMGGGNNLTNSSSECIGLRPSGVLKRRDSGFLSRLPSMGPQVPLHRQNSEKNISVSNNASSSRSNSAGTSNANPLTLSSSNGQRSSLTLTRGGAIQTIGKIQDPTPQKTLKMNFNPYTPPTEPGSTSSATTTSQTDFQSFTITSHNGSKHTTTISIPISANMSRYLKDFQTESSLGRGSFGRVDLARNRVDGWSYAIKRMKYRPSHHKEALDTVLNEIFMLASLNHPHIVRYHGAWIEGEADDEDSSYTYGGLPSSSANVEREVFIQTEFCYGGSLSKWWPQWLQSSGIDTVLASAAAYNARMRAMNASNASNSISSPRSINRNNASINRANAPINRSAQQGSSSSGLPVPSFGSPSESSTNNSLGRKTPKPTLNRASATPFGHSRPTPVPMRHHQNNNNNSNPSLFHHSASVNAAMGFGPSIPDEATIASAILKVESKLCEILRHVCKALVYLHDEKHVVHLDVKPDNIFVQQETLNLDTAIFKMGDCGSMRKIPGGFEGGSGTSLSSSLNSSLNASCEMIDITLSPRMPQDSPATYDRDDAHDAAESIRKGMTTPPPPSSSKKHTPTAPQLSTANQGLGNSKEGAFSMASSHATPTSFFPTFTSSVPSTPLNRGHASTSSSTSATNNNRGQRLESIASVPTTPMVSENNVTGAPLTLTPLVLTPQPSNTVQQAVLIDGDDLDGDGRYLAPELLEFTVLLNDQLPKADMFALGCSIIELAHVALHGAGVATPASGLEMPEGLSPAFKHLLSSLMNPLPENRPSAAQVLDLDLLQPPEVLHLRREVRRMEEKLKEMERQREALERMYMPSSTPRYDDERYENEVTDLADAQGRQITPSKNFASSMSSATSSFTPVTPSSASSFGLAPITPSSATSSTNSSPGYSSPSFALKSSTSFPRFGLSQSNSAVAPQANHDSWKQTASTQSWRMEAENARN